MKQLHLTDASARSLAALSICSGAVAGVALDSPGLGCSGWIAALTGSLFPFVLALMLRQMRALVTPARLIDRLPRVFAVIPALGSLFDAAVVSVLLATSASYISLDRITTFYLLLPLVLLCAWCLFLGGDALGGSARIWGRFLTAVLLIAAVVSLPEYRPSWLTPVLGPGARALADGALHFAGWSSLPLWLFLFSEPDEEAVEGFKPCFSALTGSFSALLCLLLLSMLSPVTPGADSSRFFRLDVLLSNGRLPLGMQLPMTVLWFVSLFFRLTADAFIAFASLLRLLPRLKAAAGIPIVSSALCAVSLSGLAGRSGNLIASAIMFPVAGAAAAVCAARLYAGREGRRHD